MKERLTTRVFGQTYSVNQRIYYDDVADIVERLAEYEDKIESGELVERSELDKALAEKQGLIGEKFCLKHSEKDYYLTEEDAKGEKACEDCREQVRKETAKEILQELYNEAVGMNNETVDLSAYYIKNTLAKEYGVEVEE